MANSSHWRLFDRHQERLMHEGTTWGIGHKIGPTFADTGKHIGPVVDATWLKTHVKRLASKRNYFDSQVQEKVPPETMWKPWQSKPKIAEELGCDHFFVNVSRDGRYRIELEVYDK